eukprot:2701679-Pyramimonas_sp.AAC.1
MTTTTASARIVHLVARGGSEDLSLVVGGPGRDLRPAEGRRERGRRHGRHRAPAHARIHESESYAGGAMRRIQNLPRKFRETQAEEDKAVFEAEKVKFVAGHPDANMQVDQAHSS